GLLLRDFTDLKAIDDFLRVEEPIRDPEWPWSSADEYRARLDEARRERAGLVADPIHVSVTAYSTRISFERRTWSAPIHSPPSVPPCARSSSRGTSSWAASSAARIRTSGRCGPPCRTSRWPAPATGSPCARDCRSLTPTIN